MSVKTIPLLIVLILNAAFPMFAEEKKETPEPPSRQQKPSETQSPEQDKKSSYFQDSGSSVDSLVDRIRFKISFSMGKSAEYFRLACSSITDSAQTTGRDIKAHADRKKDELLEKGRQAVRETTKQAMEDISRKGDEIRQDLNKAGQEAKDEAAREIREKTDKIFK